MSSSSSTVPIQYDFFLFLSKIQILRDVPIKQPVIGVAVKFWAGSALTNDRLADKQFSGFAADHFANAFRVGQRERTLTVTLSSS